MLNEILHNAQTFRGKIAHLKSKSPVYPRLYIEDKSGVLWASTIVHFKNEGETYARHHVESIIPNKIYGMNDLLNKLHDAVKNTIDRGLPCYLDEKL
jgi:hypothetical protein